MEKEKGLMGLLSSFADTDVGKTQRAMNTRLRLSINSPRPPKDFAGRDPAPPELFGNPTEVPIVLPGLLGSIGHEHLRSYTNTLRNLDSRVDDATSFPPPYPGSATPVGYASPRAPKPSQAPKPSRVPKPPPAPSPPQAPKPPRHWPDLCALLGIHSLVDQLSFHKLVADLCFTEGINVTGDHTAIRGHNQHDQCVGRYLEKLADMNEKWWISEAVKWVVKETTMETEALNNRRPVVLRPRASTAEVPTKVDADLSINATTREAEEINANFGYCKNYARKNSTLEVYQKFADQVNSPPMKQSSKNRDAHILDPGANVAGFVKNDPSTPKAKDKGKAPGRNPDKPIPKGKIKAADYDRDPESPATPKPRPPNHGLMSGGTPPTISFGNLELPLPRAPRSVGLGAALRPFLAQSPECQNAQESQAYSQQRHTYNGFLHPGPPFQGRRGDRTSQSIARHIERRTASSVLAAPPDSLSLPQSEQQQLRDHNLIPSVEITPPEADTPDNYPTPGMVHCSSKSLGPSSSTVRTGGIAKPVDGAAPSLQAVVPQGSEPITPNPLVAQEKFPIVEGPSHQVDNMAEAKYRLNPPFTVTPVIGKRKLSFCTPNWEGGGVESYRWRYSSVTAERDVMRVFISPDVRRRVIARVTTGKMDARQRSYAGFLKWCGGRITERLATNGGLPNFKGFFYRCYDVPIGWAEVPAGDGSGEYTLEWQRSKLMEKLCDEFALARGRDIVNGISRRDIGIEYSEYWDLVIRPRICEAREQSRRIVEDNERRRHEQEGGGKHLDIGAICPVEDAGAVSQTACEELETLDDIAERLERFHFSTAPVNSQPAS